jgi:methyl coenzyme M reductase subunit D
MEPIPLPSPVQYELILQLLERKTNFAVSGNTELKEKVRQLIITLRKAIAQQKQIEDICSQSKLPMEYFWSLNHVVDHSIADSNDISDKISPPV